MLLTRFCGSSWAPETDQFTQFTGRFCALFGPAVTPETSQFTQHTGKFLRFQRSAVAPNPQNYPVYWRIRHILVARERQKRTDLPSLLADSARIWDHHRHTIRQLTQYTGGFCALLCPPAGPRNAPIYPVY